MCDNPAEPSWISALLISTVEVCLEQLVDILKIINIRLFMFHEIFLRPLNCTKPGIDQYRCYEY